MSSKPVQLMQPVSTVVEHLELALAKAKAGELRTVAIAGRLQGGDTFTAYDTNDVFNIVATLEVLKFDLLAACEKTPTKDPRQ